MSGKHIRLVYGTLALPVLYVACNVTYKHFFIKNGPSDPQIQAAIQRGQAIAETCTACHYVDQRNHFVGPYLVNVVGRPIGQTKGYEYSEALQKLSGTWTPERLTVFLTNPQKFAPGTKMALSGWTPEEAQSVVAYLQSKE